MHFRSLDIPTILVRLPIHATWDNPRTYLPFAYHDPSGDARRHFLPLQALLGPEPLPFFVRKDVAQDRLGGESGVSDPAPAAGVGICSSARMDGVRVE